MPLTDLNYGRYTVKLEVSDLAFDRLKSGIQTLVRRTMPDNLWIKCERCHQTLYSKQLRQEFGICPHCGAHFRIGYKEYLDHILEAGSFEEMASEVKSADPLHFEDRKRYADRIREARKATGLDAAVCVGIGKIDGWRVGVGIHEPAFIMGTLSSAEGERFCRLIDRCIRERLPLILICRSGGARMQESALSLMQLAKINARLARFADAGLLFISILTDPTTAGVSASYALIGDINIAEPNALIGFTGERITGSSVGEEELEALRRAQRAEKVLENGFVDMIVPRNEMQQTLASLFSLLLNSQSDEDVRVMTTDPA
jgi:acetyl-CoA carboxylase carboxyl transferase subunit beta